MQFTATEILMIIMCAAVLAVSVVTLVLVLLRKNNESDTLEKDLERLKSEVESSSSHFVDMGNMIFKNQESFARSQKEKSDMIEQRLTGFSVSSEQKLQGIRDSIDKKIDDMRVSVEARLDKMRRENLGQLDEMRKTVDEKLQKTLEDKMNQSFALVSKRLEEVYKGLGEMQTLAVGVGDLKKVLSNVKTRGVLGEIQLSAILSEILSKEQYDENVAVKKGSSNVVEFAVKLPGDGGDTVYLPIDSKFPGDTYAALRDAVDSADKSRIEAAEKALVQTIKKEAKDIHDKYIDPPNTTEFAIMFLPFEGLYSEVVNMGLVETLQRDYHVNIAGPSTMAALLNSLQMGFRTLAVQKRSAEVWQILSEVKNEFDKFNDVLVLTQQRLDQANKELDKLVGVRTRQIQRKLKSVESAELPALSDGKE